MHSLLSYLSYMFAWMKSWFIWLFGAAKNTKIPPVVYQLLHVILILGITITLALVSTYITPRENVRSSIAFVQDYYWGILFLLFYVVVRVVILVVRLYFTEDTSEYADIERAWHEGLQTMLKAGHDTQWLPVFLVLGLDRDGSIRFFNSSRMKWSLGPEDSPVSSVLSFHGNNDAIFVSCSDVGATATQMSASGVMETGGPHPGNNSSTANHSDTMATLDAGSHGNNETMVPHTGTLMPGDGDSVVAALPAKSTFRPPAKISASESAEARRRLAFLCRLLTQERGDFCAINGVLVVVPIEWASTPESLDLLKAVTEDLKTVSGTLQLAFPVSTVYGGMEKLKGLEEFVKRGSSIERKFKESRAGSRFPAGHAVDHESGNWVIDRGLQWFRGWIYSEFSKDLANDANKDLYRLICELEESRDRMTRQLELIYGEFGSEQRIRMSGVYYCASGRASSQQAFVGGVLQKLISEQDLVAWTPERLRRDQRNRTTSYLCFVLAMSVAVLDFWLVWNMIGS